MRQLWPWAVAIACAFLWAVWPGLQSFYVADDFVLLARSVPHDAVDAGRYFRTDWGGSTTGGAYYRPMVNASLWLNREYTGVSPLALRTTGLLVHLAVSVLLVVFAQRRLGLQRDAAVLCGGLFLVFPLHDQAILWIAARADLLCALFYVLAFIGLTGSRARSQIAGALAFAAALASKEMAITLPLAVVLWWLVVERPVRWSSAIRPALLSLTVLLGYLPVRIAVLGGMGGDPSLFAVDSRLLSKSLQLSGWAVLPFDLERVRDFARVYPVFVVPLYAAASGLLYIAARQLRGSRSAWFGAAWIAITILPVVARPNTWYAYIPSLGGCVVLASLCDSFRRARMWYGAGLLAVSAIGLREGAERIAQASVLSETVVTAAAQAGRELFVVNSPIVVADRYLVVTDQSQFDSAATVLNLPRRTIALNYAYVESRADNRCDAYWQDGRIIASVDVGRRSFLTLDGTGVADTAALVGRSQSGHFASYRVTALSRGHIARVEITPSSSAIVPASTRTWSAGQLTPLQ